MPPKRKYATLEEWYQERNRRRWEHRTVIRSKEVGDSSKGICTVALTAVQMSLEYTQSASGVSEQAGKCNQQKRRKGDFSS